MNDSANGLLLLDKPNGLTSFDCVSFVRRKLGIKRVGHCGTLDPAARGLLMILVGPATRLQDSFLGLEKQYWFRGEFGRKTSTGDLEGDVISERPIGPLNTQAVETVLPQFIGDLEQTPPAFAALKFKGKPYYHYARQGVEIPRVPRAISIRSFDLLAFERPYWDARVICSRGTYIRTLVEDVAERLQTCGTLVDLIRERVGPFKREQGLSWEEVRKMDTDTILPLLLPVGREREPVHA